MKRKFTVILVVLLVVTAISASVVFAKENDVGKRSSIDSMFDAMRNWKQQAQENDEITEEEARKWEKHFEDMKRHHERNGFKGHCGGFN